MERGIEYSAPIGDEVRTTTCYMCACRCGIRVHLKDGAVRYIEGNPDHPVNRGVLCAKGSAGIMQHYSPARLARPLLRTGERGRGEFREISWDEAIGLAVEWLRPLRETDPRKLAFFTGRDQSQALTGWWASRFGTPNHAAHGGFCSVNMAAAGLYSIGASFWGVRRAGLGAHKLVHDARSGRGPRQQPHQARAREAQGAGREGGLGQPGAHRLLRDRGRVDRITPGTDGLLVLSLAHELLRSGQVDAGYLASYTNAPWLVVEAPGDARDGLFARDAEGRPLVWDRGENAPRPAPDPAIRPALRGRYELPDGTAARPAFEFLARRVLDPRYAPDAVAGATGVPAATIRRLAAEMAHAAFAETVTLDVPWTDVHGRRHETMVGRPVAFHAMRGISAHSNGFQTCRALHVLQMLLGTVDVPGGFRYKAPFPKPAPPPQLPAGRPDQVEAGQPMPGPPLGFPRGPDDLLVDGGGRPNRIDKAFSWEAPIAAHGMLHTVIRNAWAGDPYPIDTLFLYMANMAWNSAMNTAETAAMLTDRDPETGEYRIPRFIYSDAFASETVAYADLVLPDTTYLERWDCISMLDRPIGSAEGPADSIRQPVVAPDRDVRPFQDVLLDIGARLGLPGLVHEDGTPRYPGGYPDFLANHEYRPGVGSLAGWRGPAGEAHGTGEPNPDQLARYVENGASGRTSWSLRRGTSSTSTATTSPTRSAWDSSGRRTRSSSSSTASRSSVSGSPRVGTGRCSPPRSTAPGSSATSTPCRSGTSPSAPGWIRGRVEKAKRPPAGRVRGRPGRGPGRSMRSPSARWRCTTRGARRTRGSASSTRATASMYLIRWRRRSVSRTTAGCSWRAQTGAFGRRSSGCGRSTSTPCGRGTRSESGGGLEPRPGRSRGDPWLSLERPHRRASP